MREWIALAAAIIALITAIITLTRVTMELQEQRKKIVELEACSGVIPTISEPTNEEQVSSEVFISGVSTIHTICQFIFIVVRDIRTPVWMVADLVQVNAAGRWAGVARLDKISGVNAEVEITVRVTARPTDYGVGQFLSTPPVKGVPPNNPVRVRRIQ